MGPVRLGPEPSNCFDAFRVLFNVLEMLMACISFPLQSLRSFIYYIRPRWRGSTLSHYLSLCISILKMTFFAPYTSVMRLGQGLVC